MPAQRGSNLLISRGDGGGPEVFTAVGALKNASINFNGNPIDVTTRDDVDVNNEIWQTFITGPKSGTISGDGLSKDIGVVQDMYNDFATGAITNYQVLEPNVGTWEAPFIVSDMSYDGPYDEALSFNVTLQLAGAPTFTPAV